MSSSAGTAGGRSAAHKSDPAMSSLLAKSAALSMSVRLAGTQGSPHSSSASRDLTVCPGQCQAHLPLMKKHGLLLERYPARLRAREHDGRVATIGSNCRWCSDTLKFACWKGEVVRVGFALDYHDREAIPWVATTAGISGEMIRDMMVRCIEQRFGTLHAPYPVQWLSDNGSIFAAHNTIEIALALNLVPCFTPVESPESDGMAEALVKTFKRDYVRVHPIPNAVSALALIDNWMEDYITMHPQPRPGNRSPGEYILCQPAACSV